ncbi:MAG: PEP-CTERM sorting domain-containing protein [Planctomycetaceae bacterium]|nr:PEP-CTERM sorting domain-containing protein [Planctomycetaceae bacterium]
MTHHPLVRDWTAIFVSVFIFSQSASAVPVTDGLVLWLDATDPDTLFQDEDLSISAAIGDPVGGWQDKSGNDFHGTQFDDVLQPTYQANTMNGLPSVRFDGLDGDGMVIDDDLYLERDYTAFIVNQYWGNIQGRTLQARGGPNWLHGLWGGNYGSYAEGWVGFNPAEIDVAYVADTVGTEDGSSFTVNGGNQTESNTPVGNPGNLGIGSSGGFAEVSDADVSEIVIYDRILSDTELSLVRDHLYTKYDVTRIPDLPPPPEQNVVLKGSLGTFTAVDEGVDFEGEFLYAVDVGGFGDVTVGDAEFTDGSLLDCCQDGVDLTTDEREILEWHGDANYGDLDLEQVMQSIRWSAAPAEIAIELEVEAGTPYTLQLLFAESCCDRGFDIMVEDEVAVENFNVQLTQGGINNGEAGVVYSLSVIPEDNNLEIVLGDSGNDVRPNPSAPDNNPILNGFTLEIGGAVIEGDFNNDGLLDAEDLDLLSAEVTSGNNNIAFDLNGDNAVTQTDRTVWVEDLKYTYFGDANFDGQFNSTDFVAVFVAAKYEDEVPMNAGWSEGDWNGDGDFDSSDFVTAFTGAGFEVGPRPAPAQTVPEPSSSLLLFLGILAIRRRRQS